MSIQVTRLHLAVDVAAWSRQAASPATAAAAFAAAYEAVAGLGGTDDWAETVLVAAWELARAAAPRGADLQVALTALAVAHAAVEAVPPDGRPRSRPRRDA